MAGTGQVHAGPPARGAGRARPARAADPARRRGGPPGRRLLQRRQPPPGPGRRPHRRDRHALRPGRDPRAAGAPAPDREPAPRRWPAAASAPCSPSGARGPAGARWRTQIPRLAEAALDAARPRLHLPPLRRDRRRRRCPAGDCATPGPTSPARLGAREPGGDSAGGRDRLAPGAGGGPGRRSRSCCSPARASWCGASWSCAASSSGFEPRRPARRLPEPAVREYPETRGPRPRSTRRSSDGSSGCPAVTSAAATSEPPILGYHMTRSSGARGGGGGVAGRGRRSTGS